MLLCNLYHAIIDTLKHFAIINLPLIYTITNLPRRSNMVKSQISPTELYYYSTDTLLIILLLYS